MTKIACIGEVMIELAASTPAQGEQHKALSYAGDTYNTAVSLARLGARCAYITRLGNDHYSDAIIAKLADEQVDPQHIVRHEGKLPGLYMIHNRPDGERTFFYWRSEAPARQLFSHSEEVDQLEQGLQDTTMVYLSGITLAIISPEARAKLLTFLQRFRARGGKVAFDSNYRPRLWDTREQAQQATQALLSVTDLALLTLDDEELLWGDSKDSLTALQERYRALDIEEIVIKRGAEDVVIINAEQRQTVGVTPVKEIVDTTAAGDTFNAGYLAARMAGQTAREAAQQANRCAGVIIRHRGGVIDRELFLQQVAAAQ